MEYSFFRLCVEPLEVDERAAEDHRGAEKQAEQGVHNNNSNRDNLEGYSKDGRVHPQGHERNAALSLVLQPPSELVTAPDSRQI